MPRSFTMLVVGVVAVLCLAVAGGIHWYKRPTRLTVAISRGDADDFALVTSAANLLDTTRNPARLQIQPVDSSVAAAAAVDAGKADLAVIRTDLAIPATAQTVVILHRDAALLVAPAGGVVKDVAGLAGHTVGMVRRGAGNEGLLATTLAQAELPADAVKVVGLRADEVEAALRSHAVDAVMAVDVLSSPGLRDIVRAVAAADVPPAGGRAGPAARARKPPAGPTFLAIDEADAIAQRSPAYEKTEVVHGTFGGTPPRPLKDYDTLSLTHRLVANENVSQDLISGLTQFFLTEKSPIAATAPLALRIEAPSTDKGAALPVHAGSAAYIDDDEETFFDKYSDYIYIGAMLTGVLASGVTAVLGRLSGQRTASLETSVARLVEMLAAVRHAPSTATLDDVQAEADGLMAEALQAASAGGGDDRRLTVFGMALDQLRAAVRDRRAQLTSATGLGPAGERAPGPRVVESL